MRHVAALLAFGGAVALVAACFLPILEAGPGDPGFVLLDFDGPVRDFSYGLEVVAAAVLAAVLGVLLLARPKTRLWLGLLVTGIWMTAFFVSYAWAFAPQDEVSLGSGEWIGLVGGLLLLGSAGLARRAEAPPAAEAPVPAAESGPPAGWYADPAGGGGMRWWDGTQWTHETRSET